MQPSIETKQICSTITEFEDGSFALIPKFVKRGYKADDMKEKVERVSNIPREVLLQDLPQTSPTS